MLEPPRSSAEAPYTVGVVQAHRTYTKHTSTERARCVGCLSTRLGWFKHSEPTRTTPARRATCVAALERGGSRTANLIEPHRTYTNHTITEIARCVGCLCTRSGWFKHSEPQRSYTIHTITELARCVGCFCTRAGWFKHIEPHRTYTLLTITELARCVGCFCTRAGWFKHIEPHRTYTNHTIKELARCVGCLGTSSGGSSTSNLHEPHPHSSSKVCRVLLHEFRVVQAQRTYTNHTI